MGEEVYNGGLGMGGPIWAGGLVWGVQYGKGPRMGGLVWGV